MTVVASAGPSVPQPQPGAPPTTGCAPGGVFAALFGTIDAGDGTVPPEGSDATKIVGLLQGLLTPAVKQSAGDPEASGDSTDKGDQATQSGEGAALALLASPLIPAPPPPATAQPQDATIAAPQVGVQPSGTLKTTPAGAADAPPTPDGTAEVSGPTGKTQQAIPLAAGAELPDVPTEAAPGAKQATADPKASPPAPALPAMPSPPPESTSSSDAELAVELSDDAQPDAAQHQPNPASKKIAAAPNAASAKGSESASGNGSMNASGTAPATVTAVASTAPADPMIAPLATNADAGVKTVSVSNLAALSQQAAVTAIGTAIATEASGGTNRFVIRLDPPELGRIDVRLHFDRDGELRARLVADRPDTVSLLTRDAGALERALNASGVRTSDAGIDVSLRDSSGGFAQNSGTSAGDTPSPAYTPARPTTAEAPASHTFIWTRPQTAAGRLDLMV